MNNKYMWIGIIVGVFFAGLGIGAAIFMNSYNPYMMQNPQLTNSWMNNMMSNPQMMNTWTSTMLQNPQFMNQWMASMMQNTNFLQQYMGSWMMFQNPGLVQGMMKPQLVPPSQTGDHTHLIVKTNQVSIVNGAWQINTTESYSPTIIQIISGTTVTWTNNDSIVHTVTDLNGTFDSHLILPNTIWKHDFFNEGKYNYFCTLHPWMKGLVIVTE